MYFPIGWPKVLKLPELGNSTIRQVTCNLDKILFAILTDDTLAIWFCKPCVPIVFHRRTPESLEKLGLNCLVEWKPDSSMLAVATSEGHLIMYKIGVIAEQRSLYIQTDSPHVNLRRDSAELFIKEIIPPLHLTLGEETLVWDGLITSMVCITMNEIMVASTNGHILRYRWDGTQNRDYCLDLRRIPFCINKQVSKAEPIVEENVYVSDMEYSPLVGGFSVALNDGRAAFLTASSLRFDPNTVQGIWAQNIEDATCASLNHKFRLIAFGRRNAQCTVYTVDETTGGLEISHECALSSKDYPGCPGAVKNIKWTPDGCAMVVSWENGGIALWSTFGALLMCTLGWDYGLNVDLTTANPLLILSMDWSAEGYQLWMIRKEIESSTSLIQLDFVKSALSVNPCMSQQPHLYLQGDDRLYVNLGDSLLKSKTNEDWKNFGANIFQDHIANQTFTNTSSTLAEARQWLVISMPAVYSATNWPVKYTAIDFEGYNIAVSGRTGLAHYSLQSRKWKLFGNETQEKDFIVTGGLLWWEEYIIMGSYSILDNSDELRLYPRDCKLDNKYAKIVKMAAQVLLLNCLRDQLIVFCADGIISVFGISKIDSVGNVELTRLQAVDVGAFCIHPTCVVSVALSSLRTEPGRDRTVPPCQSMVLNVNGRLLMIDRDRASPNDENGNGILYVCGQATVLASNVESVWVPGGRTIGTGHKPHLTEALWLACGAFGMRVWLPLFPRQTSPQPPHAFISKRIMLPFQLNIYPLAILFEDAIILGAENDTILYTSDAKSPFSLPFCVLERTSQVYLHQILRQLIRRNLGYNAWEIARSCMSLSYFPHSLELLLHEVLEEEATSKEPIPDAQLPSVIEFISEFPVYLQTVVQCARKTEIALWPYLFSAAGKPKKLFQECMNLKQLDTAASYLIILQNLEASTVSRQYATLLLDTALEKSKWELAKELVRFLRAIDPNDVESPRNSFIIPSKLSMSQQTPPVSPNAEDLSIVLGSMQVARNRSYSTTNAPRVSTDHSVAQKPAVPTDPSPQSRRKKSVPISVKNEHKESTNGSAEEFFIDVILQRHARRLLSAHRLPDLGYFAAHLDFHLVAWLGKERDRAARIDDFVKALKQLHEDFTWPYPDVQQAIVTTSQRNSIINTESPLIEDRIKALRIETSGIMGSQVGDSGYMSFPSGLPHTGLITPVLSVDTQCASSVIQGSESDIPTSIQLEAQMSKMQRDANSVLSGTSSIWDGDRDVFTIGGSTSVDSWSEVSSAQLLEQLSHQIANRGSNKSEVQLRYLLQLFMEASCLEWSLLVSVLLRDAMAVLRTVNAARSPDQPAEAVKRLRDGLQMLYYWTHNECLGYKPFMVAIQNQITVLNKLLVSKQQYEQQIIEQQNRTIISSSQVSPALSRSRRTSSNHDNNSQSGGSTSNHQKHRLDSVSSNATAADMINDHHTHNSNASHDSSQKRSRDHHNHHHINDDSSFGELQKQTDSPSYSCVIS